MKCLSIAHLVVATVLGCAALSAQGSQTVIGGGCPNRSAPTVSGPLTINSTMSIDDIGCFTGQGGFGIMFFGSRLQPSQWLTLSLSATINGPLPCDIVVLPLIGVSPGKGGSISVPIPNDPRLQGQSVSMQAFCNECGFAGCYELLTQGLEITIG